MSDRVASSCDQCGQTDDHPKLHYGLSTWHHDCTPVKVREEVIAGSQIPDVLTQVFAAAASGVHGNDLVNKIAELHEGVSQDG